MTGPKLHKLQVSARDDRVFFVQAHAMSECGMRDQNNGKIINTLKQVLIS